MNMYLERLEGKIMLKYYKKKCEFFSLHFPKELSLTMATLGLKEMEKFLQT